MCSVPFSNTRLRVPLGFENLLEAFAREAIAKQPANLLEFGAVFFERMLSEREGALLYPFPPTWNY